MPATDGLSTAEAYVLISLPRFDARKALKLGLMGLLAQRVLRMETENRPGLFRTRHIPHLYVAPGVPRALPPVVASLVAVVRSAEPEGTMKKVVAEAMRAYGRSLAGFAGDRVLPSLAARGLAEPRKRRLLGLIPATRFYRTPSGETEKARLDAVMRDAREIPRYLDSDPAQAAALAVAAGAAILLVEGLRPHYDALSRALRPPPDGGNDGAGYTTGFDGLHDSSRHDSGIPDNASFSDTANFDSANLDSANFDFANFDFANFDFGSIDFGAFDAGGFDSFDAGFSDAGGGDGGGGDGGGGDGGSSGC
jgi:hypothetical protein